MDAADKALFEIRRENERLKADRESPEGVARILADYVNRLDNTGPEFAEEMGRQHRTLQQNFTRLCVAWLQYLGTSVDYMYDNRNQASVMLGREFVEKIPAEFRNLPTI